MLKIYCDFILNQPSTMSVLKHRMMQHEVTLKKGVYFQPKDEIVKIGRAHV